MKLNLKALAVAGMLVWGLSVFLVALAHTITGTYGQAFLEALDSLYPGYHASPGVRNILVGTLYAGADGLVGGLIVAWIYNRCARS